MRPITVEPEQSIYQIGSAEIALRRREPEEQAAAPAIAALRKRSPAQIATAGLLIVLVLTTLVIAAANQFATHLRPELAERLVQGDAALRSQGFNTVHFRTVKQKELEIAGTVPNAAAKNRLREWLAASAYKDARFKVHAADSLVQQVRDALGDASVQVRFDRGRLSLEGTTSRLATRQRIRSVTEDLQGVIAVDDRVAYIEAPESPGPLPVRVRDVKVGDARYFSADNGARYFEGALLPDGAEVIAIDATQIRFRRGGRTLVYELNGGIAVA
jgi:type III secretion protein D